MPNNPIRTRSFHFLSSAGSSQSFIDTFFLMVPFLSTMFIHREYVMIAITARMMPARIRLPVVMCSVTRSYRDRVMFLPISSPNALIESSIIPHWITTVFPIIPGTVRVAPNSVSYLYSPAKVPVTVTISSSNTLIPAGAGENSTIRSSSI